MERSIFTRHFMVKKIRGRNEYDIYKNYVHDLPSSAITSFLSELFQGRLLKKKNDLTSLQFRQLGNNAFKSNDYKESLKMYTKSLCHATYNSEEYATTLANRSAVFFKMNDYENCIKDVDLCLQAKYPDILKPKVYIRKAECYKKLGEALKMRNTLTDLLNLIESMPSMLESTAENYRKAVKELITEQADVRSDGHNRFYALPSLEPNASFFNASSSVELQYKNKGAHVVAKREIARGDVLFVEKAYAFAHFNDDEEAPMQCQNCLVITASCVPCKGCIERAYCTEKCRDSSWKDFHQWECVGIQAGLFVVLSNSYLALRIIFKGLHMGLCADFIKFENGVINHYGSMDDNYPYVHSLPTNIEKINKDQLMAYTAAATVMVNYLKSKTDFFTHLKKLPAYADKSDEELMYKVGGLIIRHSAQLQCHAIGIQTFIEESARVRRITVGDAVCPAMSMMNHSCAPNTAYHFVGDTVVVKALYDINSNQEIFRAYLNVELSSTPLTPQRQAMLEERCSLKCKCRTCADRRISIEAYDAYNCIRCNGPAIPEENSVVSVVHRSVCLDCNYRFKIPSEVLFKKQMFSVFLASFVVSGDIEDAYMCLQIGKTIFRRYNEAIGWLYEELSLYFLQKGNIKSYMEMHKFVRDSCDKRLGNLAHFNGFVRYSFCVTCIELLKNAAVDENLHLGEIVEKLTTILNEAKLIIELHYPPFLAAVEKVEKAISELRMLNVTQQMDNMQFNN